MVSTSRVNRPAHAPTLRAVTPPFPQCALCGDSCARSSWLASGSASVAGMLWVCVDCQHKLARRVDDVGVLGG